MAKSFDELANRTMTAESRARAAVRTRAILREMLLSEIRANAGKSQSELARTLGIKQPTLSKLENQRDMQISTLRRIVEALGGRLEIIARFPGNSVRLEQFGKAAGKTAKGQSKPKSMVKPSKLPGSVKGDIHHLRDKKTGRTSIIPMAGVG